MWFVLFIVCFLPRCCCRVLSALAVIAELPQLVEDIVITKKVACVHTHTHTHTYIHTHKCKNANSTAAAKRSRAPGRARLLVH